MRSRLMIATAAALTAGALLAQPPQGQQPGGTGQPGTGTAGSALPAGPAPLTGVYVLAGDYLAIAVYDNTGGAGIRPGGPGAGTTGAPGTGVASTEVAPAPGVVGRGSPPSPTRPRQPGWTRPCAWTHGGGSCGVRRAAGRRTARPTTTCGTPGTGGRGAAAR